MNRIPIAAALCLAAAGLSACNNAAGRRVNAKICYDFKATTPQAGGALPTADVAAPLDDCLRRWAYSLAPSTDMADVVSDGVVAACTGALTRWNQQGLAQGGGRDQAISITTGQPTTALAEHANFAHARALLYVVAARAGACEPPPITNGAPTGLQP
jgi:hypothetical protein